MASPIAISSAEPIPPTAASEGPRHTPHAAATANAIPPSYSHPAVAVTIDLDSV